MAQSFRRPRAFILFTVTLLALALAAFLLLRATGGSDVARAACPKGYMRAEKDLAERYLAAHSRGAQRDSGEADSGDSTAASQICMNIHHPEMADDLAKFGDELARRAGGERPGQIRAALRQKARLADATDIPGANGTWQPLGKGPLIADDPNYPTTKGDAYGVLGGRISDYAYNPGTGQVWATVAQGGVWESDDRGQNWFVISDGPNGLPMQSAGGIAWTPAGGDAGTLIVLTGDHAFSNDYSGEGVYYTTDDGRNWTHAKGVPDGLLSFQVVVDPTNPKRVYAASGGGLYRSDDAGRSWENVKLPTGDCAGDSFKPNCFFANIVTGVQVQATDKFGHKGGAVVAAVGWRAGTLANFAGKPQSPANGIYRSDTGNTGSFTKVNDPNLPPQDQFGRTELGAVTVPTQNSNYVYAIVQDSKAFDEGMDPELDSIPKQFHCDPIGVGVCLDSGSVLNGIYSSSDFGKTWKLMESRQQITNDTANGSTLNQLNHLGISAGYQTTYNEWIKVDPTQQDSNNVPTHLLFGMEELWQNSIPGQPMDGQTRFEAYAPYNFAGLCLLTVTAAPCGQAQSQAPPLYTTHPDQHGGMVLPSPNGGIDLFAGDDGGNYVIHSANGHFTRADIGRGNDNGFHTLLPYGVAMAKDGTVYAGLQDNGELKIDPKTGQQNEVYVGDGVFTIVNPNNSNEVIEEYPTARPAASNDGGVTWTDMSPTVENPDFASPLVQDPLDYKHISTGGRQVVESTSWTSTTTNNCTEPNQDQTNPVTGCSPGATDWVPVFDLGTYKHPGDPNAGRDPAGPGSAYGPSHDSPDDPVNIDVADALYGAAHYVGFCGSCDPVKLHEPFHNGIATNVGGDKPPKVASPDGWHVAKAQGLPNRIITGITIDPKDTNTIYVTLGSSAARPFAPLGSLGDDTSNVKGGYVYVSHDHGDSFTDVTGDLPKVQASWVRIKGNQLVVANAIGMFISNNLSGDRWAPLGQGFPTSPVYSFEFEPQDPNKIVVASYGRGVWQYDFTPRKGPAVLGEQIAGGKRPACSDRTGPTSRFLPNVKKAVRHKGKNWVLSGTSAYRQCKGAAHGKVKRVLVQLKLQISAKKCRFLTKKGRLGKVQSCKRTPAYLTAKGTGKWSFTVKGPLPPGKYVGLVKARDDLGNTERQTRHRNFRHFRIRGQAVIAGWHGKQSNTVPPPGHPNK